MTYLDIRCRGPWCMAVRVAVDGLVPHPSSKWAVTRAVGRKGWSLTHIPTGLKLTNSDTEERGLRACEVLEASGYDWSRGSETWDEEALCFARVLAWEVSGRWELEGRLEKRGSR